MSEKILIDKGVIKFLELISRLDKDDKVEIYECDKETRKGSYVTIRKGLTTSCWFIGKYPKDNSDNIIAEFVA